MALGGSASYRRFTSFEFSEMALINKIMSDSENFKACPGVFDCVLLKTPIRRVFDDFPLENT